MNCVSSNSPIDITDKNSGICDLKCKYLFKYNDSSSTINNKGKYLSLTYDKPNTNQVIYNSIPYYVEDIRIYTPSLHTYNGSNAEAELIIIHTNDYNEKLLVCIPIVTGTKIDSLDFIIETAYTFAKTNGESTYMSKSINLNNFIPLKKMYVYKGKLPFSPCNGDNNIIVFNKNDGYLPVSTRSFDLLNKIIMKNVTKSKDNIFFINKKGPQRLSSDTSGEIYIDCKPISDDGKVISDDEIDIETESPISDLFSKINYKSIVNNIVFQIIMSILGTYMLYKLFFIIINNFKISDSYIKFPIKLSNIKSLRSKLISKPNTK